MVSAAETFIRRQFAQANIEINGSNPWDMQVHKKALFKRLFSGGSLALGESYMDNWWDCAQLDEFFTRIFLAGVEGSIKQSLTAKWLAVRYLWFNMQSQRRARQVAQQHYDRGNQLFSAMLDKRLTYSCAYWRQADDLDAAQDAKLDLICRKLSLQPGMHLADIGCGWGSLLAFAAEKYGVQASGITLSEEQARWVREKYRHLPIRVTVQDYRNLQGEYDAIASVGMVEHVGYKNYPVFMRSIAEHLRHGGRFLLHTIGSNQSLTHTDPWIEKYIFPNSMLPSIAQLTRASEPYFLLEDWHNFGPDYARTLMAWEQRFVAHWPKLEKVYDQRFYRMWRYYLLISAASFRARRIQLWQYLFVKPPAPGPPQTIR